MKIIQGKLNKYKKVECGVCDGRGFIEINPVKKTGKSKLWFWNVVATDGAAAHCHGCYGNKFLYELVK